MFSGYKTYVSGVLMIAVGLAEMFGIDVVPGVDTSNAGVMVSQGIGFIFVRMGVKTDAGK